MDDVKASLDRAKLNNHNLEVELRGMRTASRRCIPTHGRVATATVEQKARNLQAKVTENVDVMDRLRQERSMLLKDHKQLQQQYADVNEVCLVRAPKRIIPYSIVKHFQRMNTLRDQLRAAQKSHYDRRHELDLHVQEIEDLRRALTDRENELERAEVSKVRVTQERSEFARTVRELEGDLLRVRKDAERFGSDLRALRREKDKLEEKKKGEEERARKAERGQNQLKTELKLLKEELEGERGRNRKALEGWKSHVCAAEYVSHITGRFRLC